MHLGIRPTNDYAFIKVFGSKDDPQPLISLLNAILQLPDQITDIVIDNPFNAREFEEDKLSILDIKAHGQSGSIYDIEMQLEVHAGLLNRLVYYGCKLYGSQLLAGNNYAKLKPTYTICLLERDRVWRDSQQVHHAFRFTDRVSGRLLDGTLEIHLLQLACYNLTAGDLARASTLDEWLFWLLHAHQYPAATLLTMFAEPAIQEATRVLIRIAEQSEDKRMYDLREKAIRDKNWIEQAKFAEGKIEGKIESQIEFIRLLQESRGLSVSPIEELQRLTLEDLQALTNRLLNS